jgi:prevent-host-death family protein
VSEPESIGIRELRQHASRYVSMAKEGKRVPVTVRGKLVAYLVPAENPTSILDRLEAAGELRRGTGTGFADLLPPPPAAPGTRPLTEVLQEMRDEERY